MATVLICHVQNFRLTTFKELKRNNNKNTWKINITNWEMNSAPYFSNIWWNSARSLVWGISWWYSRKIRLNGNVINGQKQKSIRYVYTHINSLWHSDAIWQHRSGSTLTQIMVCCLRAPSLNQCWLINWVMCIHLRAISQSVTWMRKLQSWKKFSISQGPMCKTTCNIRISLVPHSGRSLTMGEVGEKSRYADNKYFVWQWDQCYWNQMLLNSRTNIYVMFIIDNSKSNLPYMPL